MGENDGLCPRLHHLQLKADGRGLEATWWTGAEENRTWGGSQASPWLHQWPRGSSACTRAVATEVPHFLVTGSAAVLVAAVLGMCGRPFPGIPTADAFELFL